MSDKLHKDNERKRKWAHSPKGIRYRAIRHIIKKYNISRDDAVRLYEMDRVCEICGDKEIYKKRHHIDHNHTTGKIRGILCTHCNTMLGGAKDDIGILHKAIQYLRDKV